ncbi:hypothetical protein BDV98DRAFT_655763 [Pterulicium gracile]|uniref:Uncharacterized protein n=1 Tax=Pterulicium gracile TaxID=1884261 RepID=A0A5C3QLS9_9AGAR|nr:hypothetical protein BDV98DRAFT_655763 [Pterula gracilis]
MSAKSAAQRTHILRVDCHLPRLAGVRPSYDLFSAASNPNTNNHQDVRKTLWMRQLELYDMGKLDAWQRNFRFSLKLAAYLAAFQAVQLWYYPRFRQDALELGVPFLRLKIAHFTPSTDLWIYRLWAVGTLVAFIAAFQAVVMEWWIFFYMVPEMPLGLPAPEHAHYPDRDTAQTGSPASRPVGHAPAHRHSVFLVDYLCSIVPSSASLRLLSRLYSQASSS